ncbi:MAG: pilin N-terminal domain-containing protein [Finegoldia magna]|uniref:isopeptide-forming domain-containing fimbrial protein n=1 Tax=Finegoldia magna TaxID=1260 RepID=UPI00290DC57D|nr:pilin N-terminal domain-containing protein [Finegoldia magna]MDU5214462.1 pilin N-terminal domain-containing protein [Finegoldia magna]MDU5235926.1 pilin N-terminal domain-containing protein [Finegoldia magna]
MKKRFLSLIIALAMMVGVFTPLLTSAAGEKTKVRIHKILMDKDELNKTDKQGKAVWPKDHDGSEITNITDYFGAKAKAIDGVAFRIYEVYTGEIKENKEPAGYTKGEKLIADHKLATGDLVADKYYKLVQVDRKDFVLSANGGIAEVTLANGTYRVVEDKTNSTYKGEKGETLTGAKAVPFDLVLPAGLPDGTGNYSEAKSLNVYPKNVENPVKFDKNFAKKNGLEAITDPHTLKDVGAVMANYDKEKANAKAEIGKEIPYEAKAELPKGAVFKHLDLADSMDKGLQYDAKKSVTVTVTPKVELKAGKDYTVTTVGNGFKVHFEQAGLDKLNKAAENADLSIEFTYSAKVTAEAIVDKPMDNHATFTYNHEPPKPSSKELTPVDEKINVKKDWADGNAPTNIFVKYVLLDENDMPVADVTFKNATTIDGTDLGNGITFEKTGNYTGTFKGLEKDKKYKVKEIVNGYEPEYTVKADTATVTVKNTKTPTSITPTPPQVTVGGKKFVKTNQDGTKRLAGAEFVIQNKNKGTDKDKYLKATGIDGTEYTAAEKAYNDAIKAVNEALAKGEISATKKVTIDGQEYESKKAALAKVEELRIARDKAFEKNELSYTWVDDIKQATTFTTNDAGQFEVRGIEYGDYRAVETKAPAGFALPTDGGNFTFKVYNGTYTGSGDIDYVAESTKKDAMQIKNNDVTIPQTGGIGTIIFTAIGLAIMASAIIAIKKRQATEAR